MDFFKGFKITSPYGERISPISGKKEKHTGIDLVKKDKADLPAFVEGECIHAQMAVQFTGVGGFGNVVLIKDKNGYVHLYGHLDSCSVKKGELVKKGQTIGKQGNTGQSAGSHLHYEIRTKSSPTFGWRTDTEPTAYLEKYYAEESKPLPKTPKTVKVKEGDTLSKIAKDNGLTIEQLLALNKEIKDANHISIGQLIIIKK